MLTRKIIKIKPEARILTNACLPYKICFGRHFQIYNNNKVLKMSEEMEVATSNAETSPQRTLNLETGSSRIER